MHQVSLVPRNNYTILSSLNLLGKFGAASPERERKLLSLAEPGPQTKRVAKLSKSSYSIHSSVSSTSPGQSPVVMRRDGQGSKSHERSHSDPPPVPVGLTAESSSVAIIAISPAKTSELGLSLILWIAGIQVVCQVGSENF